MDNKTLPAHEVLRNYGDISRHTLQQIVDFIRDDDEINLIKHSSYYSPHNLPSQCHGHNNFNVLSLNCQSINAKYGGIDNYLTMWNEQNVKFDVICIQESWLCATFDTTLLRLDGYNLISQPRSCSLHGGLMVYVQENYKAVVTHSVSTSDIWEGLFVKITDESFKNDIIVGNIYKPPRNNNNNENIAQFISEIDPILSDICLSNSEILLFGDYNINLLEINEREAYSDFFDKMTSFSLYPKITVPTRLGRHRASLIDNAYCKLSECSLDIFAGVMVSDLSDHLPYFISLKKTKYKPYQPPTFVKQRVNSQVAKDNMLNELISTDLYHNLKHNLYDNPDQNFDILHNTLLEIKEKHLPYKFVKFNKHRHKNKKWMTLGIIKSIKFRDNLYYNLKQTYRLSPAYLTIKHNLTRFNKILKNTIKEAKKTYYSVKFQQYQGDMKNTWKAISEILCKSSTKKSTYDKIIRDGVSYDKAVDIAYRFNEFFVDIGPSLANKIDTKGKNSFNSYLTEHILTSFKFKLIDVDEARKTLSSLRTKNSSGHDGISVKLLKHLAPALLPSLTLIINQSLLTGIFPGKLKIAKVIPLHKKGDTQIMDNYRPVSLLSSISKLFEKVAYNQLYSYFKTERHFYDSQYGFRDEHSTEFAALEMVDRIVNEIDAKNTPISIFMDLSKAFDTLNHAILLKKLKHYGISDTELKWFKSYLENRYQYVEINNEKSPLCLITTGVPQGSILGPLLFLIYMNDIVKASSFFKYILYADDTNLQATLRASDEDNDKLVLELNKIRDWLAVNKLSLNILKTKYMIFHPKGKNITHLIPHIVFDGIEIERVENFNFLGLIINEHLSWKPHTDCVANKISKYVGILNKLKHFIPADILKTLYNSMIQSHLNYSILAWGFECNRLVKLQKKIVRIITSSKYNAHTEPLMKQLNILKINDLFRLNSLKFFYKYANGKVPSFFVSYSIVPQSDVHDYSTRFNNLVSLNVTRTHLARRCLRNNIQVILNSTPSIVLEKIYTHSFSGFVTYAKQSIINSYSNECTIPNCYVCNN